MLLTMSIAVFNGEKHLAKMLDSILTQSFTDYELLLINDGSTDRSGTICDCFARKHGNIRVVHKQNEGLCASRNLAMRLAEGKYICFADQDDFMYEDTLEIFSNTVAQYKADFYISSYCIRVENSSDKVIEHRMIYAPDTLLDTKEEVQQFYIDHLGGAVSPVWNMFFELEYLKSSKLQFDEKLRMSLDDLEFHSRSFFTAENACAVSHIGIEYYVRAAESSSRKYNMNFQWQCQQVLHNLKKRIEKSGIDSPGNIQKYYKLAFQLYLVSGLQNCIYAKHHIRRENIIESIQGICEDVFAKEIIAHINDFHKLSRYENLIFGYISRRKYKKIYHVIMIKEKIKASYLLRTAKRYMSHYG